MIDAINQMCLTWGGQKIAREHDTNQGWPGAASISRARDSQFDPKQPADPLKSLTARGRDTFSIRPTQFTEEGHTGDGLVIARALTQAPEGLQTFAFVHYAIVGFDSKEKARRLSVSRTDYWCFRDKLHYWLWGRLEGENRVRTHEVSEIVMKTIREALKTNCGSTINSHAGRQSLDFTALRRHTLTR